MSTTSSSGGSFEVAPWRRPGPSSRRRASITTSYSLLTRLQNWDDEQSWRIFFDRYWRLIHSMAVRSGLTETEAEDVVQETVLRVAKDIQKFQQDRTLGSFKGWLRNLTRWRIADQLRKREQIHRAGEPDGREDNGLRLEEISDPAASETDKIWEEEWQANLLEAAIERVRRRVKAEHYQIFDLYVVKKWPVQKVARRLGVSTSQIYVTKHRVAALLKKEVQALESRWD